MLLVSGLPFATGIVAGSAASWLFMHRDAPALHALTDQGVLTTTLCDALRASAWRPSVNPDANPPGTKCDPTTWNKDYEQGILNVDELIDIPIA
jgi:hypothetical protein